MLGNFVDCRVKQREIEVGDGGIKISEIIDVETDVLEDIGVIRCGYMFLLSTL